MTNVNYIFNLRISFKTHFSDHTHVCMHAKKSNKLLKYWPTPTKLKYINVCLCSTRHSFLKQFLVAELSSPELAKLNWAFFSVIVQPLVGFGFSTLKLRQGYNFFSLGKWTLRPGKSLTQTTTSSSPLSACTGGAPTYTFSFCISSLLFMARLAGLTANKRLKCARKWYKNISSYLHSLVVISE